MQLEQVSWGNYDQCCWQVLGEGQFRPLVGSNPAVGELNTLKRIPEYRIEMLCQDKYIKKVIQAMKNSHPYEAVAYHVLNHSEPEK